MREIVLKAMQKLEFFTGLKQMNEYTDSQISELLDSLCECAQEYKWLTPGGLEYILKNGMKGRYGEFYHLNVKTLSGWIKSYYKDNEQRINQSLLKKEPEKELSDEEKAYWIEIGKQGFRDKFKESKEGSVAPLYEWGPYFYDKFKDKGLLVEEKYPVDEKQIEAEIKLSGGVPDFSVIVSKKKDRIWRMFIRDMIKKEIDLTKYL